MRVYHKDLYFLHLNYFKFGIDVFELGDAIVHCLHAGSCKNLGYFFHTQLSAFGVFLHQCMYGISFLPSLCLQVNLNLMLKVWCLIKIIGAFRTIRPFTKLHL